MQWYTILGVEHVYDAFDEYEHPNSVPAFRLEAASVDEAIRKGGRVLQDIIYEQRRRGGYLSSGTFIAEVIQVLNHAGKIVYQGPEEVKLTGNLGSWNLIDLIQRTHPTSPQMNPEKGFEEEYRTIITPEEFRSNIILIPFDKNLIQYLDHNPEKVFDLTPREFEELIAEIMSRWEYSVKLGPLGPDGGVDIYAEKENEVGLDLILVQCKRYAKDNKVTQPTVKQLHADVYDRKASKGLLVTTSYFTKPAIDYIEQAKYRLSGVDFDKLQIWLQQFRQKQ